MRPLGTMSALPMFSFGVVVVLGLAIAYGMHGMMPVGSSVGIVIISIFVGMIVSSSMQVANQWDKAVVLRMGKYQGLHGPGLFFIIPLVDTIAYWVDTRVITMSFKAEKTLTKDTVPVDVDAVLFWKVVDPEKAALDVAEYQTAIGRVSRVE